MCLARRHHLVGEIEDGVRVRLVAVFSALLFGGIKRDAQPDGGNGQK